MKATTPQTSTKKENQATIERRQRQYQAALKNEIAEHQKSLAKMTPAERRRRAMEISCRVKVGRDGQMIWQDKFTTPAKRDAAITDFTLRLREFFREMFDNDETPDDDPTGNKAWHLFQEIKHIANGFKYVRPDEAAS